jgi:hypothetical protein
VDIQVECYSGHEYAQRPVALWWERERVEVVALLAEAHRPGAKRFTVETQDNRRWVIEYHFDLDSWTLIEMIIP